MNVLLRFLSVQCGVDVEEILVVGQFLSAGHRQPQLPVRLAVQLIGAHEARARALRCPDQHHVGGHPLVFLDYDQVAHLDFGGGDRLFGAVAQQPDVTLAVDLFVPLVPSDVVDGLSTNRHRQHKRLNKKIKNLNLVF